MCERVGPACMVEIVWCVEIDEGQIQQNRYGDDQADIELPRRLGGVPSIIAQEDGQPGYDLQSHSLALAARAVASAPSASSACRNLERTK